MSGVIERQGDVVFGGRRCSGGGTRWRLVAGVVIGGATLCVPLGSVSASGNPSETPASGRASNMGVCSPFLGQLGIRPDVNELVRELGPFLPDGPYESAGELYRIRAQEKPTGSPAQECVAR